MCVQLLQHDKNLHYINESQCGECVITPGDSDRSNFMPASSGVEEIEVGSTELLDSKEEEADEGRDTTMYFCRGREAVSPGPPPDSSFTNGCKVEVALGTVLVTGEADWEELRVITYREDINTYTLMCCGSHREGVCLYSVTPRSLFIF